MSEKIRELLPEEEQRFLDLYKEFIRETLHSSKVNQSMEKGIEKQAEAKLKELKTKGNWCFVPKGPLPTGFLYGHLFTNRADKWHTPGTVEIESAVDQRHRLQGIGTLLKEEAIKQFKQLKKEGVPICQLLSEVEEGNKPNQKILKNLGFKQIGEYTGNRDRRYLIYTRKI